MLPSLSGQKMKINPGGAELGIMKSNLVRDMNLISRTRGKRNRASGFPYFALIRGFTRGIASTDPTIYSEMGTSAWTKWLS